ncbi:hypothetical protein PLESTB_000388800 [Pleodorina starrii]|uniref:Protein kinase domain-containing protein n=1 Tax=Pleodorina starrii TaxID=330485 RepID=A0A9W6EZQ0_9CHLO|nr:hypothetical protein PLESTB_000388800 [Pleodorina starrii]
MTLRCQYKSVRLLGSGSSATVILCRTEATGGDAELTTGNVAGNLVAVKRFHDSLKGAQGAQLLDHEAAVLSAAQPHPNVVRLLGSFFSASRRPHLVMEAVPRSLASELRCRRRWDHAAEAWTGHDDGDAAGAAAAAAACRSRVSAMCGDVSGCGGGGGGGALAGPEVKLMAWQLARALAHLHDKKIAHCDVRPANVLLDDMGVLKLADFGSARFLRHPSRGANVSRPASPPTQPQPQAKQAAIASRWYQAPEVLAGSQCGCAADVWSYGCTVAELAMGTALLPGSSHADQLLQIMRFCGLPPFDPYGFLLSKLSAAAAADDDDGGPAGSDLVHLVWLLESCLRIDPNDRVTAAKILRSPYFADVPDLIAGTELEAALLLYGNDSGHMLAPAASPTALRNCESGRRAPGTAAAPAAAAAAAVVRPPRCGGGAAPAAAPPPSQRSKAGFADFTPIIFLPFGDEAEVVEETGEDRCCLQPDHAQALPEGDFGGDGGGGWSGYAAAGPAAAAAFVPRCVIDFRRPPGLDDTAMVTAKQQVTNDGGGAAAAATIAAAAFVTAASVDARQHEQSCKAAPSAAAKVIRDSVTETDEAAAAGSVRRSPAAVVVAAAVAAATADDGGPPAAAVWLDDNLPCERTPLCWWDGGAPPPAVQQQQRGTAAPPPPAAAATGLWQGDPPDLLRELCDLAADGGDWPCWLPQRRWSIA